MFYVECKKPGSSDWTRLARKYPEPLPVELIEWLSNIVDGLAFRMVEPDLDWAKAKAHFDEIRAQYESLPPANGGLALAVTFCPLLARYVSGERTEELHDEMMAVQ